MGHMHPFITASLNKEWRKADETIITHSIFSIIRNYLWDSNHHRGGEIFSQGKNKHLIGLIAVDILGGISCGASH